MATRPIRLAVGRSVRSFARGLSRGAHGHRAGLVEAPQPGDNEVAARTMPIRRSFSATLMVTKVTTVCSSRPVTIAETSFEPDAYGRAEKDDRKDGSRRRQGEYRQAGNRLMGCRGS